MDVRFRPKILETISDYSARAFLGDLTAGITVGIVALPLAMAFAIASGVKPEAGIVTAVISGLIISALGGSRVQIGGPTGAFIVIVYATVAQYGLNNLLIATMMAGVILIAMGFAGMGKMIKFIPYPVTTGFTSGIAVVIFTTQIKDFLGLRIDPVPADFVNKVLGFWTHIGTIHVPTVMLAIASLALIRIWPVRWGRRIPGSIAALVVGTLAAGAFSLPVETIGSRFGGIPRGVPPLEIPQVSWQSVQELFRPALTIALLAAIESLLSAVVADGMIEDRHDSNQELVAQGMANLVTPLFGGIPATGAIARTATNVRNGGRTPIAGLVHALVLLAILLVAAPLARFIPLATLSAVLVVVSMNMGEWHQFKLLTRWPRSDALVFLATFSLTVLLDLTVAVETGMVLAAILFIRRVAESTHVSLVDEATETEGAHQSIRGKDIPEGVMVFRVFGALFFGAADKLETALKRAGQEPEVLILRMRKVLSMDATGINALEDMHDKLRAGRKHLVLSGPQAQPLQALERVGFIDRLGRENVCPDIDAALSRAREILRGRSQHTR